MVFLLTAGLAAAGLVALAVGALTRGGGGSPPASTLRAVADSLTIAGRQRYLIQARALTANDRGRSPRIVGVAGGPGLHGAISLSRGASTLIYRPDPAYSGVASFTYTVRDAEGTLAVGHVRLTVTGFTNAQRALLAYVPSDVVGTCVAAARLGALARVQCRASVGALTFASYASKEQADRVFETSFVAPTGDCTRKPGTGTWYWPTSPKKDAGRYGCSLAGKLPRFGWTYSAARYFAIAVGPKGTTIAALARWFFVGARLKR